MIYFQGGGGGGGGGGGAKKSIKVSAKQKVSTMSSAIKIF